MSYHTIVEKIKESIMEILPKTINSVKFLLTNFYIINVYVKTFLTNYNKER